MQYRAQRAKTERPQPVARCFSWCAFTGSLFPMKTLLTAEELRATLARLAREIADAALRNCPVAVVGIRRRGETLARRLLPLLATAGVKPTYHGALDITLYRDDLTAIGPSAIVRRTEIDFDITDTWLVLVDDVLYTGRSVRSALSALTDLGRPRAIRLAVLIDRGLRELPIQPDFVGLRCETTPDNDVQVSLVEEDGEDKVELK
jgi:pyrimidine operon attenuation protein/uracil phosphoribosyltransferase